MKGVFRIALVGDYNSSVIAHRAIPEAIRLASTRQARNIESVWVHTGSLEKAYEVVKRFDGIWCVPASPYANMQGALDAIRFAREEGAPFLGTCGGFQHALIEYARNVLNLREADHGETNPSGPLCLIAPMACSLVEQNEELRLAEGSLIRRAYGTSTIIEDYHCSYGLNADYEHLLFGNDLTRTAWGASGEVRAVELSSHPFYVATLFQPERRALKGDVPPIVGSFAKAVVGEA